MNGFKAVGVGIGALAVGLGLAWIVQGNHFFMYKYFGPQYQAVEREIFENTPSYKWGMVQELENMKFQYEQAKPEHKLALGDLFVRRANQYGRDRLPSHLSTFLTQVETDRRRN